MTSGDDLDWDDLRYFLRAADAKTLAGAARALGVEHTTIGRRLRALERSLGAPLVLRGPDGLQLTPLAERLLPLVEDVDRAVRAVREAASSRAARVRLAVPSGMTKLFAARLARLREAHPEVALELIGGARAVDLKKGEADLALRSGPIDDAELIARKLCDSGFSLYAADAYLSRHAMPIKLADLSGHELIGYDASLAASAAAKWIEQRASAATIVLRSRELADMLAATAGGAGIAVLPCVLGDAEPGLRRITPEVLVSHPFSLVYRREAKLSEPVCAVIDFVVEVVREAADQIRGVMPKAV